MSDTEQPSRRLKVALVVRDEADDPSILDIVRVAIEDGLRAPSVGSEPAESSPRAPSGETPERHAPLNENLEDRARAAVEEALTKVIERFKATGQEPKFDPAQWVEKLSKVWAVIHKARAAGVQLRVLPSETDPPPAEAP